MNKELSNFKFLGYKIDLLRYNLDYSRDFLVLSQTNPNDYKIKIGIRNPIHIKDKDEYLCGVNILINYSNDLGEQELPNEKKVYISSGKFSIETGICGLFKVDSEQEKDSNKITKIMTCQAPAILYPYLRASVASFLLGLGMQPLILPLVNFVVLAENSKDDLIIKEYSTYKELSVSGNRI